MPSSQPWSCELGCLRSRCVVRRTFRLRIHPRSKRQRAENALRARTAHSCPPIEEHPSSRMHPLKLRASRSLHPHPRRLSHNPVHRPNHRSRRANPSPRWSEPAVLGSAWQATGRCNLCYATCTTRSQLGRGVHLVSVCGHALRAPSAAWASSGQVQTGGLSERVRRWR